jgi:uncharacterized RDD family membrane protein YckC
VSDPSQYPEQQPPPGAAPPPPPPAPPPPPPSGYSSGYGQQQPAYSAPNAGWGGPPLAEWPKRAGAFLIDSIGPFIAVWVLWIFFGIISDTLGFLIATLGWLAALAWALYNAYLAGQTGQSYGMQQFKIRLVDERTGQAIGGGLGIARYFVHIIDGIPCYIGWLWPLWDAKKQTFTDKIFTHVVLDEGR